MKMVKKPDTALLNLVHSFYLCDWREITSKARKGHSLLKEATDFLLLTYKITFKEKSPLFYVTEKTFESD